MKAASFKDYLELHFIVFLWGFTAILGKLISVPAVELVFYRTLISATALFFILYFRKTSFQIGCAIIIKILAVGFMISAHWILFFASARVSSVAICLAGISTVSLWTAILEPIFTDKRLRLHEIFMAILIIVGLYLIFRFEVDHVLGIVMGVASAFLGAAFTIINSKLVKQYKATVITLYEMAGACLGTLLFFPIYAHYLTDSGSLNLHLTTMDIMWMLLLAIGCTVYPFTSSVSLMQRISAFTVNLSINLEPVYGIIFALFIFKDSEHMSAGFYFGAVIILFSVFGHAIIEGYLGRKEKIIARRATADRPPENVLPH